MERGYFKAYYSLERNHWWFRARAEILKTQIRKVFKNRRDLKILNAGAATGFSSEWLGEFGEVSSLEYDRDCFEFTRDVVKIPIVHGSILELPFENNQFDLVVAFDVVEHVPDDVLAIQEMQRVTKKGGYVFVSVPAFNFLWSQHDDINHHYRRYTESTLKKIFNSSTLHPIYQSYFNAVLFLPIAVFRLTNKFLTPLKLKGETAERTSDDLSVATSPVISKVLYQTFISENILLKRGFRLPFGVSIMAMYKNV